MVIPMSPSHYTTNNTHLPHLLMGLHWNLYCILVPPCFPQLFSWVLQLCRNVFLQKRFAAFSDILWLIATPSFTQHKKQRLYFAKLLIILDCLQKNSKKQPDSLPGKSLIVNQFWSSVFTLLCVKCEALPSWSQAKGDSFKHLFYFLQRQSTQMFLTAASWWK